MRHPKDDRADAAGSMYLAWTQNMHKHAGAHCWRREDALYFALHFRPRREDGLPLAYVATSPIRIDSRKVLYCVKKSQLPS